METRTFEIRRQVVVSEGEAPRYKIYSFPQIVIARFVAGRTVLTAAFLALVFGAFVASKSAGFAAAYPTEQARAAIATSFGNNVGLEAIFGIPHHITSVTGFTVWNTLNVMMIFGAIWGFFVATRSFRGEEDAGRWELLLSGQTNSRLGAANALVGLGAGLLVLYLVVAVAFTGIGRIQTVNFNTTNALFFAAAAVTGAAEFIAIGSLTSQLMPTRGRAISLAAAIFGTFFLVRAAADVTTFHWLLNISPLGWIENMQPLYGNQVLWMLPPTGLVLVVSVTTIFLAGKRDLGGSIFADNDTASPRTALLGTPFTSAIRLTRASNLSWLLAVAFGSTFFGILTKSAADALNESQTVQNTLNRITHSSSSSIGAQTFLGILFFLLMLLIMSYVASSVGRARDEEAEGYLDNLLVRPVSRIQWLFGRIVLITAVVIMASLLGGVMAWFGANSQGASITFHDIITASLNTIAPAMFVLGAGILGLGFLPRLTSVITYGIIGWSFLIEMVSSGINLNQYILDTSVLHHVTLAPAVSPDWNADLIIAGLGVLLCVVGVWGFNRRDLQSA